MKLLTQELRETIPPLRSTENEEAPLVRLHLFTPDSNWDWWITEGEEVDDDYHFFGLVRGHAVELGYVSLRELESVRGPLGLPIERDLFWVPVPLPEVALGVS